MHGDLRDWYEDNVLSAPEDDETRIEMLSLVNIVCGNVEMECAYAAYHFWKSEIDGGNILQQKVCAEECKDQAWDQGFDDYVNPCSSLMHSLSSGIILIISLIRFMV